MEARAETLETTVLACGLALSLAVFLGLNAFRHGLADYWGRGSEIGDWQRAAAWEPDNAENWHRLGRYYQTDFEHGDLGQAISDYQRATSLAPGTAAYWLDLAEARETAMQLKEAEQAFNKAHQVYPISAEVDWRFGNFLLRQNRQDEAFRKIREALTIQPSLTALAISRCWQSTRDIHQILALALPPEEDAYWGALDFLVDSKQPDAALVVWDRLMSSKPAFRVQRSFPLQDMLIEQGEALAAKKVWQDSLVAAAMKNDPVNGSAVWNGSFEQDLLNGGFGWRFRQVPGVEMTFDARVAHSQGRSLRVEFDGSANLDFQQPWQYLLLEPNTRYRLLAYFRAEGLRTSSPIRLEIEENHFGNAIEATPPFYGTPNWVPVETEFTTGPQTALLRLALRRRPSPKLDNKISGTLWIDDVSIVPLREGVLPR